MNYGLQFLITAGLVVLSCLKVTLQGRMSRQYVHNTQDVLWFNVILFAAMTVGFYGLHVHEAVLEKGVRVSGATVHIVTPECDAGPIVLQKAVEVLEDDTPEILQKRIMEEAEWKILPRAVRLFCDGRISVENNKVYIKGE